MCPASNRTGSNQAQAPIDTSRLQGGKLSPERAMAMPGLAGAIFRSVLTGNANRRAAMAAEQARKKTGVSG